MSNSRGSIQVVVSPNGSDDGKVSAADHQSAGMSSATTKMMNSPKVGPGGQCLCSPTTHQGSFRCRFHRSMSSSWMMKRSKSMPAKSSAASIISPKSVEST